MVILHQNTLALTSNPTHKKQDRKAILYYMLVVKCINMRVAFGQNLNKVISLLRTVRAISSRIIKQQNNAVITFRIFSAKKTNEQK